MGKRTRFWSRACLLVALVIAGVTCLSLPRAAQAAEGYVMMIRLYNPNSGEHFYTANQGEAQSVCEAGWRWEGVGWTAPTAGKPVYRLYNPNAGDHHYTLSAEERDKLVSVGWRYEGVGWNSDSTQAVPLYRQYNPNAKAGAHNFTTSTKERDNLVSLGWRDEGTSWYGSTGEAAKLKSAWITTAAWGSKATYLIGEDGQLVTSKRVTGPNGYDVYLTETGAMATGTNVTIDGTIYSADANGRLTKMEGTAYAGWPWGQEYLNKMLGYVTTYGSDTDYFVTNDVWNFKLTVFKRSGDGWVAVKWFKINRNGGTRTESGLKKVTMKAPSDQNGAWWANGAWINDWFTSYHDVYHDTDFVAEQWGGSNHARYFEGKGYWEAQGIHAGYEELKNNPNNNGSGCTCLNWDEAKWVYDNVPVGSSIYNIR